MWRAAAVLSAAAVAIYATAWTYIGAVPWPIHNADRRSALLTELGMVSASGRGMAALTEQSRALSERSPLDATPFLVVGGIAEQGGDADKAARLYGAAMARDPRSVGSHFMLARRALGEGDADLALRHLASMARQSPGAGPEFSTMMMAVANDRSLDRSLRRFLAREPKNREALFEAMAADATLTERLVELAPVERSNPPRWLAKLLETELLAGRNDRAASAWVRFGGGDDPRQVAIRDPRFTLQAPPPPFGWLVSPSDSGAIAASARGLDIETYGRASQPLVSQTLLLPPGRYGLRSATSGDVAPHLEWRLRCLSVDTAFATLPVGRPGTVTIPPACNAQLLGLWTREGEDGASSSGKLLSVSVERLQ